MASILKVIASRFGEDKTKIQAKITWVKSESIYKDQSIWWWWSGTEEFYLMKWSACYFHLAHRPRPQQTKDCKCLCCTLCFRFLTFNLTKQKNLSTPTVPVYVVDLKFFSVYFFGFVVISITIAGFFALPIGPAQTS